MKTLADVADVPSKPGALPTSALILRSGTYSRRAIEAGLRVLRHLLNIKDYHSFERLFFAGFAVMLLGSRAKTALRPVVLRLVCALTGAIEVLLRCVRLSALRGGVRGLLAVLSHRLEHRLATPLAWASHDEVTD